MLTKLLLRNHRTVPSLYMLWMVLKTSHVSNIVKQMLTVKQSEILGFLFI